MFSVQMPAYSADNSFESDFSEIGKPVESGNYQDKDKFKNIFDSASSDYKEKKHIKNVGNKQVQTPDVERDSFSTRLKSNKGKKIVKKLDKNLFQKNEKLISLKKGKIVKPDIGIKKRGKKNPSFPENLTQVLPVGNEGIKGLLQSVSGSLSKSDPEKQNTVEETSVKKNSVKSGKFVFDSNAAEFKSPLFKISDFPMNKVSLKKRSIDKKTAGIKKPGSNKMVKSKLSILDLRESNGRSGSLVKKTDASALNSQKSQNDSADQLNSENQDSAKPIVVELTHIKDNFSSESKTLTTSSGSELMKQLEESINSKIVKQSSIVLKDSGAGEIKLILKPEQLGNVRIKLTMQDNRISGHIIVDNASVKDIFENNLHNLERAFRENGFDTAALNVSVGGDHSGNRDREKANNITKQIELIDESIPTVSMKSDNLIDLVV